MNKTKLGIGLVVVAVVGGLAALLLMENTKNQRLESELQILRTQNQEAQSQEAEREPQQKALPANGQLEAGSGERNELLKLRGEVASLRKELQVASNRVATAAAMTTTAANNQQQTIQNLQQELANIRMAEAQQRVVAQNNACINNLRQLDGAKAQWALENRKTDNARVTPADIAPYLKGGVIPSCPQGGTYTVTTVAANPTCSIPGHNL